MNQALAMDPKNMKKITVYDDTTQVQHLPSSGKWTRAGLSPATYNKLDRLRARIDTNSLQYIHAMTVVYNNNSEVGIADFKLITRIDLCGDKKDTAHGGVRVPHAQVTVLMRQDRHTYAIPQAFELPETDIEAAIDGVDMPPATYNWLFDPQTGMVPRTSVFAGSQITIAQEKPRFALRDSLESREFPEDIMVWNFDTKALPQWSNFGPLY